jgi:hypothetical protein
MLLNFLVTFKYTTSIGPQFYLGDKYFLEKQSTSKFENNIPSYKVVLKRGIFHQTIKRDISFNGTIDSVKVIEFNKGKTLTLRGYILRSTFVSTSIDSSDIEIILSKNKAGQIQYQL